MPRVNTVVARASKRERNCTKCSEPIEVGQAVHNWTRRNYPTQYMHVACGFPKPSQLYSRKTASIEDLLQDADFTFSETLSEEYGPGDEYEIDTAHVTSVLEEIADVAESVGEEYEESADNLPEGLQQGYQAEALRDVAERLRSWADELRQTEFETSVELSELLPDEGLDTWRDDAQGEVDAAIDSIIEAANDAVGEMPEYEG